MERDILKKATAWFAPESGSIPGKDSSSWRKLYLQFGVNPAQASSSRVVTDFRKDSLRELKRIDADYFPDE